MKLWVVPLLQRRAVRLRASMSRGVHHSLVLPQVSPAPPELPLNAGAINYSSHWVILPRKQSYAPQPPPSQDLNTSII